MPVAAAVEIENHRIDAQLIGDGLEDGRRNSFAGAERPPEIADQGELHSEPQTVMRATPMPGERNVHRG